MKKIRLGPGFVVFLLFFGIALLDALHRFNWLQLVFWLATGAVFIIADSLGKTTGK